MPEGDTIFRAATTLRRALVGRAVTGFRSPLPAFAEANLVGHTIAKIEAHGKNLLIFFDDGRCLYSHMRMEGSWHIYKPGIPWQKPERQARCVIETDEYIAICFNAPVVELLTAKGVQRHPHLQTLGQDLLHEDFNFDDVLKRLRGRNELPIGVALMRQYVLAGIGNVYKSEVLFICKTNPFVTVASLTDRELKLLISKARELMHLNLEGKPRDTRRALDGQRFWVYGRSGRPCRKCGTLIKMQRQGDEARSTYWCPSCQKVVEKKEAEED